MRKPILAVLVIVTLAVLGVTLVTPAAASEEVDLEAAEDDEREISFTFTTNSNTEEVTITPEEEGTFSDVTFKFDRWEEVGGFDSGTGNQISGNDINDTTYEVFYTVETDAPVSSHEERVTVSIDGNDIFEQRELVANLLHPEFGYSDDEFVSAVFEPGDGDEITVASSATFENVGGGIMIIDDVTVTSSPFNIDASVTITPDRIDSPTFGSETEDAIVSIDVDEAVGEGEQKITVRAEDNLGNTETVTITIDVIQPPAAGSPDTEIDFGEIYPGSIASSMFTLEERGGYDSIEGLDSRTVGFYSERDISFPGLDDLFISAEGSTSQDVKISVDDDIERGETSWTVHFEPLDEDGIRTADPVTFTAEVIYPPYFETMVVPDTEFVFDEPREQQEAFVTEKEVVIENGGDVPMDILSLSADVDTEDIAVTVTNEPRTVSARSTDTAIVEIAADTDAPEGTWNLEVETVAEEPATLPDETTGVMTSEAAVSVEHETELAVEETELDTGTVIITDRATRSIDLSERLGYQDVESFTIEQVSGPDADWLTIEEQPEELNAGASEPFTLAVEFDTSAELFNTYTWEFEVDGENIDSQRITLEATPEPFDFGETVEELETLAAGATDESELVASEMAEALEALEADLQSEDTTAERDDIQVVVTAASSAVILIEASEETRSLIEEGDHEAAQTELVRATAAFNTLSMSVEDISSEEIRTKVDSSRETADQLLDELIENQESHFEDRLASEETTILEEAQITRELARLADLSGDDKRADELRESAENSFEEYSEFVSSATEDLIAARELRDDLDDDLFVSPLGQRVFFIGAYTTYDTETEEVLSLYQSAAEQFGKAGAGKRSETAAGEHESMSGSYDAAFFLSAGIGVVLGIGLFTVILWEIRALYRYRVDTEQAVSGDFLLPWGETE